MLRTEGQRGFVEGPLTIPAARQLVQSGRAAVTSGVHEFDLAGVSAVDSAGLAVLLAWCRGASQPLRFLGAPANLRSLADLYGVSDILRLA